MLSDKLYELFDVCGNGKVVLKVWCCKKICDDRAEWCVEMPHLAYSSKTPFDR